MNPDDLEIDLQVINAKISALNERLERVEKNPTADARLLDWIERFVSGDNSLEFCEEDGGVILVVRSHRRQDSFVGTNIREALAQAMADNTPTFPL